MERMIIVAFCVASFALGAALSTGRGIGSSASFSFSVVDLLEAFVGSAAGAMAAFYVQSTREARKERSNQINAVNRALYGLFHYWNATRQYQKEVIEPTGSKQDQWLNLSVSATHAAPLQTETVIEELAFLLDGKDAQLYSEFQMEIWRARTLGALIEKHQRLHLDTVYPALKHLGITRKAAIDPRPLIAELGDPTMLHLEVTAKELVDQTNSNVATTRGLISRFRAAMKIRFPGAKLINVDFDSASGASSGGNGKPEGI